MPEQSDFGSLFLGNEEKLIVEKTAQKIAPLLNGLTLNQIKKTFTYIQSSIENEAQIPINLEETKPVEN